MKLKFEHSKTNMTSDMTSHFTTLCPSGKDFVLKIKVKLLKMSVLYFVYDLLYYYVHIVYFTEKKPCSQHRSIFVCCTENVCQIISEPKKKY